MEQCRTESCERLARKGGLCWACLKCRQRNGSTVRKSPAHGVRHKNKRAMLLEAALDLAETDNIDRAIERIRQALKRRTPNTVPRSIKTKSRG